MKKKLIKIPLQFFGEPDDGDDFDDDLGYEDEEEDYGDDADEGIVDADADDDSAGSGEDGDDGKAAEDGDKATGDHADLIADLKALGFKGDDLDALKADVKARREAKEKGDSAEERRAAQAEGKSHIKGSKPQKGAGGDGNGGVTERQVVAFAERVGCSKDEARKLLAKHSRMISK
jgi:hypothetical protein